MVAEFVKPSVDWLTLTVKTPFARERLASFARDVYLEERDYGYQAVPWLFKGYTGQGTKHFHYGTRADSDICTMSGTIADEFFVEAVNLAENVSRIDLAVTCQYVPARDTLGSKAWENILDKKEKLFPVRGYARVVDLNGGETIYVGRRSSEMYGRVYDKGVQSGQAKPGEMWRYEVELKKPVAYSAARYLAGQADPRLSIPRYVYDWFAERGITPEFLRSGPEFIIERDARIHSAEITLAWLRRSVRPAIMRLVESGKLKEALEALGVPDLLD